MTQLLPGRYRVTKHSKNREFQIGDVIRVNEDGTIDNPKAGGWIDARDVQAATQDMEVEVIPPAYMSLIAQSIWSSAVNGDDSHGAWEQHVLCGGMRPLEDWHTDKHEKDMQYRTYMLIVAEAMS